MVNQRDPGWYADPEVAEHWRWWDGQAWTEHAVSADPGREAAGPAPDTTGPARETTGLARETTGLAGEAADPGRDTTGPARDTTGPVGESGTAARGATAGPPAAGGAGALDDAVPDADDTRPASLGRAPAGPHRGRRPPASQGGPAVFARRWAVLVAIAAVVVIVLVVVLRSHPPALYWQGEPFSDGAQVLAQAQQSMQSAAGADEGVVSPQSRCYFSLATQASHDVAPYVRCGPVLLPWSVPSGPWLSYKLSASPPGSSGVVLAVASVPSPQSTVALANAEVLRRPDGTAPPQGDAGLAVPVVPRQPEGWAAALSTPPPDLRPAPVADLIGDWGQSYRLVAFGEVNHVSARLDPAALRVASNPPGSGYSTKAGRSELPLAKLLLPPQGQIFVVAELAVSPGEAAGPVPSGATAAGAAAVALDRPVLEVLAGTQTAVLPVANIFRPADVTVVAAVPTDDPPVLVISDKGLAQKLLLSSGTLQPGPSVLARAGTDEPLSVSGTLPGVTVHVSDVSLVWFAGSDGGTVPPQTDEAYLQVLVTVSPLSSSFLPVSDFALELPGGEVAPAQALPDANREAIVVGFLVPASFSVGTVVVTSAGHSLSVPVHFP